MQCAEARTTYVQEIRDMGGAVHLRSLNRMKIRICLAVAPTINDQIWIGRESQIKASESQNSVK